MEKGRVVSRTANDDGTYTERIIYEPPISYINDKIKNRNDAYTILINNTAGAKKLMEFGSLHIASKVIKQLKMLKVGLTVDPDKFKEECRSFCSKAIDYIIGLFSKTTIRMS